MLIVQLSHPYITTGKTITLTRWNFVHKVISMLFNMLSRLVIAFLPRMGTIKDINGMDLTEAEDIKRGGKNTQKNCTKKIFTTQIITMV